MVTAAPPRARPNALKANAPPATPRRTATSNGAGERARRPGPPDSATAYALAVTNGKILAGKLVRLACKRHLQDLKSGVKRGLIWKPEAGERAIRFFRNVLVLAEGEHAGKPFNLEPWQCFIVGNLFGWYTRDGSRRFRTAYIEVAKGNGKSPMAAGIGLYGLVADGEPAAEIYSAATGKDQAKIVFRDAWRMVEGSPYLSAHVERRVGNLAVLDTSSFFRPVSSEAKSLEGLRLHIGLIDELHEHPNDQVVVKLRKQTKGRRNPLFIEITNSGVGRETVCWRHHEYSEKVLTGTLRDDSWFGYIAHLDACRKCANSGRMMADPDCDRCDDWQDEKTWLKPNPNLGISIKLKYLRELVREALGMPAQLNEVLRLNFCIWTQQVTKWLSMDRWHRCAGPVSWQDLPAELLGRRCFGGLDLARVSDLSAFALLFPPVEDGEKWKLIMRFWCPADDILTRSRRDSVPYDEWVSAGAIETTPGNTTDYDFIEEALLQAASDYEIVEVPYDPTFAGQLTLHLQDAGLLMVELRQTMANLTAPVAEVERMVKAGGLEHGGHPVLDWNISNVAILHGPRGLMRPDKEKSTERIDGASALLNAMARANVDDAAAGRSIYEDERLEFV